MTEVVRKAVILTLGSARTARQASLGGLPLLLRAFLNAQRAGIEEFVIVGEHPGGWLEHDKRIQAKWRWVPLDASPNAPAALEALRQAAANLPDQFVLLFADSIFDAKALAELRAAGLDGKAARVAVSPGATGTIAAASLYLCRSDFVRFLEAELAAGKSFDGIESFAKHLRDRGRLGTVEVSGGLWPRTSNPTQLRLIHRQLTRFNLKPSDGLFAKFNKLVVAEPLIRFFLRTRATPNVVTGLGLAIAVGAGWAFAQGSYGWSLAGALLAYASAIMDHVDGMVARLKFLESDFGVWFESVVDHASYLFIFVGLSLGLYRETGFAHHLFVGALFLAGAIVGSIVTSRQRKLASADNLTDYPNRIHAKLEQKSRNFFHWFTRRCYFLTRRAVLPYFILLFCLLDLRVLLLGSVTFGANLVWLLTLYNNRLFRSTSTSRQIAAGGADAKPLNP